MAEFLSPPWPLQADRAPQEQSAVARISHQHADPHSHVGVLLGSAWQQPSVLPFTSLPARGSHSS